MKVLTPSAFIENDQRCLERFKREIESLKRLQHRDIVEHLEAGIDQDGRPYILMPLVRGQNIRDFCSGKPPTFVIQLFREVLVGVAYAHSQNVLHRDLKPTNILIRSSDEQPVILDFGCAYLLDNADSAHLTTQLVGSLSYIPDEVQQNPGHRNERQDVFACGVMLYEILGEKLPELRDYEPLEGEINGVAGIDSLILDATAVERRRIDTAKAFIARLDDIAFDI